jgi:hypothetical protein
MKMGRVAALVGGRANTGGWAGTAWSPPFFLETIPFWPQIKKSEKYK